MMKLLHRLRSLVRRTRLEADMAEELRAHLELQVAAEKMQPIMGALGDLGL